MHFSLALSGFLSFANLIPPFIPGILRSAMLAVSHDKTCSPSIRKHVSNP
eukprot:CAMPEP_0172081680 /NCGR_PEP_ID=MMETSP1043-20130122/19443_1 /TAXON_ID=464988 /ORGANISM="Hemiselmis andersenii, Strain CCMP441" /LENGTH=49 /DNA_ID= /DNA_START= /DNA_END= /DNA_ORIENTATION=